MADESNATPADGLQFLLDIEQIAKNKLATIIGLDRAQRVDVFYRPSSEDNYRIFRQNGYRFVVVLGGAFLQNGKRVITEVAYRLTLLFDGATSPLIDATEVKPQRECSDRLRMSQVTRVEKYRVVRVVASNGIVVTKYIVDEPFLGEKLLDAALVELQELSTLLTERNRIQNNT